MEINFGRTKNIFQRDKVKCPVATYILLWYAKKISWAFIFILVGTTWNEYRSFAVSRICERHNHDPNIINHSIINTHRLICACFSLDIRPTILTNCDNSLCTRATGGCTRFPDRSAVTSCADPARCAQAVLTMIDTRFEIIVFNYFCKRLKINLHYYYYFYYYTQKLNKQSTLPIGNQSQDNDCNSHFHYWVHICFEMSFSYNGQNLLVYCMVCFQFCFPHTAYHLQTGQGCHIDAHESEFLHRSSYHKLSKAHTLPNAHHARHTLKRQSVSHNMNKIYLISCCLPETVLFHSKTKFVCWYSILIACYV